MTDHLDRIDRATLVMWRLGNVMGWSLLSLAAALLIHLTTSRLLSDPLLSPGWDPLIGSDAPLALRVLAQGFISALTGLAIGGIVGAKVWRRQKISAAIVAGCYVTLASLPFAFGLSAPLWDAVPGAVWGKSLSSFASTLALLVSIPISIIWAARTARRSLV
jgi:hypothetical protein